MSELVYLAKSEVLFFPVITFLLFRTFNAQIDCYVISIPDKITRAV